MWCSQECDRWPLCSATLEQREFEAIQHIRESMQMVENAMLEKEQVIHCAFMCVHFCVCLCMCCPYSTIILGSSRWTAENRGDCQIAADTNSSTGGGWPQDKEWGMWIGVYINWYAHICLGYSVFSGFLVWKFYTIFRWRRFARNATRTSLWWQKRLKH